MVAETLVFAAGIIICIGIELGMLGLVLKELEENKVKTGRYSVPWSDLPPIRKGLLVALPLTLIGFFIWIYYYSIFSPGPDELYNHEIAVIGLFFILALIGNFWFIRN
ncbi:MAG: hypothetical protein DWB93_04260 [Candidatus Poseidoniales archaeon]|nr:MAG: hypothetical protein DWB93_04260 [Candidatus Poseidoniales archaeon]